ncbi:MAG: putative Ig domain-containing protein [Woeseia sp.]
MPESGNSPPVVSNSPAKVAVPGSQYVFQVDAEDPDGDALSYSIRNRPAWMRWDAVLGRLSGMPTSADMGPHMDILINVTDGAGAVSVGPFTVTVEESAVESGSAPVIEKHPGHYISMNRYDDQAAMIDAIRPGVTGLQKRYTWAELEPSFDRYDFSALRSDLDLLAGQGMRLVVFVEDKSFDGSYPTPVYLQADHTLANHNGGYTALRWHPYVLQRFHRLIAALGAAFDTHPAFEGVALQESSLSLGDYLLDTYGYTPELYRDALIDTITVARKSLPTSQVFWYMNYLPRRQDYIAEIANRAAELGVSMGGPDVLPDSDPLQRLVYPYYPEFAGRMVLFNSMQFDSYRHLQADPDSATKYWSMLELFKFARDQLYVDYLFWNRVVSAKPADSHDWRDALDVIKTRQIPIRSD